MGKKQIRRLAQQPKKRLADEGQNGYLAKIAAQKSWFFGQSA